METEVYLLCKVCNGITEGTGSGETMRDYIHCKKCGNNIVGTNEGYYQPVGKKQKVLYIAEGVYNIYL
jgi:hypothetical protein